MSVDGLETDLASIDIAADPEAWALAAYRLAVARSELATRADQVHDALGLLDKASRILTPERAPIEHARILTAAANGHRALGASDQALRLFERAAELAAERVAGAERAAGLINVGLARTEIGDHDGALRALDEAAALLTDATDEESQRLLGAALINRAQAHQTTGTTESVAAAIDDYDQAIAALDPDTPQAGMAAHGKGAALLEQDRDTGAGDGIDAAIGAFAHSLTILGPAAYPFQHAIARHSLAIAYERRNGPGDLARALDSAEASLWIFDPRLHEPHWRTASATVARLMDALGGGSRQEHIVELLAETTDDERLQLLRDRLRRIAALPDVRLGPELQALTEALVELPLDRYRIVARTLLSVLMEVPDRLLEAACVSLCAAHRSSGAATELDRALDDVIHDLLFGPQRVRVRDLLEANGWVRP